MVCCVNSYYQLRRHLSLNHAKMNFRNVTRSPFVHISYSKFDSGRRIIIIGIIHMEKQSLYWNRSHVIFNETGGSRSRTWYPTMGYWVRHLWWLGWCFIPSNQENLGKDENYPDVSPVLSPTYGWARSNGGRKIWHNDEIAWKRFSHYQPFAQGHHQSQMDSIAKGQ